MPLKRSLTLPEIERNALVEMIAYALWRKIDLKPKKRSLDDARVWARHVVAHLELCGDHMISDAGGVAEP